MSKKQEKNFHISAWLIKSAVYVYVILMVGIFPLFFLNSSITLISSKIIFFKTVNVIMAIMFLLGAIAWLSEGAKKYGDKKDTSIGRNDIFAIVLAIAMIVSTLISQNMQEAFWGPHGKKFGAFILLLSIFNYFVISRFFELDQLVIWFYMLGSGITYILQIIYHWKFNPLKLWSASNQFASGIGNINLNAAYDVLMLAIGMSFFMLSKEKKSERIYSIYLVLGFCGLLCSRSDLGIVGIAVAFLVWAWFGLKEEEECIKYLKLVTLFGISMVILTLDRVVNADHIYSYDSMSGFLTHPVTAVLILLTGIGMRWLYQWKKRNGSDFSKFIVIVHRIFFCVVSAVALSLIILFLVINTVFKDAPIPAFMEIARFTDSFASNRGYVWIRGIQEYWESPWKNKIFGYGSNCFSDMINPKYYNEMVERGTGVFMDAHNEFLQMLVTTGIVGVIGYFGIQISTIMASLKCIHKNRTAILPVVVIFSLLAQGLFYSPHVTITPLVFIFLGIVEGERRK